MEKFEYERGDIIDTLKSCAITAKEMHGYRWRYRAEGGNFENEKRMVVIVEIAMEETGDEEEIMILLVIEVWPQDGRSERS